MALLRALASLAALSVAQAGTVIIDGTTVASLSEATKMPCQAPCTYAFKGSCESRI